MIDCADSTMLRTHLDHPDERVEAHLDGCATCSGLMRSVAADSGVAHRAIAMLDHERAQASDAPSSGGARVDTEAALATALATVGGRDRGRSRPPGDGALSAARRHRARRSARRAVVVAAAAVVAFAAAATPIGRDLAAEALDGFRGDRIEVIAVDADAWAELLGDAGSDGTLAELGEIDVGGLGEPRRVADLAAAAAVAGIAPPRLSVVPEVVRAAPPGTARLILDAAGGAGVPDELDGAALVVDVPGVIVSTVAVPDATSTTRTPVVVARAGRVEARAEGAELGDLRDFLLGRDELPPALRAQLADIDDWRATLPLPVPADAVGWEEVRVGGRRAIAFGDDTGLGALVVREDPDGVTVVGGPIAVGAALDLAARL
ncbi:hypothetical protein [Ilumatobacter sp.]|uniref:hypothetical protein n=1 Tax=Ilumatobacter sp. TaxID=1967498 RepID=UPI003B51E838